jgi:hypothetical protein
MEMISTIPAVSGSSLTWAFRVLLLVLMVIEGWELVYPERSRRLNLRLYEWRPWIASARLRESMRNATARRLRIRSAMLLLYVTLLLLISFKVLR